MRKHKNKEHQQKGSQVASAFFAIVLKTFKAYYVCMEFFFLKIKYAGAHYC